MNLLTCILTENDCYKSGRTIVPKGVMVHSTGANNPNVARYVQPSTYDPNYTELVAVIGSNRYANDWNRSGIQKCTHAFLGKFRDGSVGIAQTLPWNMRGWHAGTGSKGSANNTHIGFEICEDGLTDPDYFAAAYQAAVELTAMLCKEYGLDPLAEGVVISHNEGHDKYGNASNHGDPDHWLKKFGKSMDDFRKAVSDLLTPPVEEESEPEADKLYRVQVGAFRNRAYAEALRDELIGKGYEAYIKTETT